jgi:hypothetical protein
VPQRRHETATATCRGNSDFASIQVAIVDRINNDLQQFRLVDDLVQIDNFDAFERLAVVVDERVALPAVGDLGSKKRHGYIQLKLKASGSVLSGGWPRPDAAWSAVLPKVADRPAIP